MCLALARAPCAVHGLIGRNESTYIYIYIWFVLLNKGRLHKSAFDQLELSTTYLFQLVGCYRYRTASGGTIYHPSIPFSAAVTVIDPCRWFPKAFFFCFFSNIEQHWRGYKERRTSQGRNDAKSMCIYNEKISHAPAPEISWRRADSLFLYLCLCLCLASTDRFETALRSEKKKRPKSWTCWERSWIGWGNFLFGLTNCKGKRELLRSTFFVRGCPKAFRENIIHRSFCIVKNRLSQTPFKLPQYLWSLAYIYINIYIKRERESVDVGR